MTTLHTLDDYDWVREDTTGDLILQDSNNAEVMRWDVSAGDWTFPAVSTGTLQNVRYTADFLSGSTSAGILEAINDLGSSDGTVIVGPPGEGNGADGAFEVTGNTSIEGISNVDIVVQQGATLRLADGVDIGRTLQFTNVTDVTYRINGTHDANRDGQSASTNPVNAIRVTDFNGAVDLTVTGDGTVTNTRRNAFQIGGTNGNGCDIEVKNLTFEDHRSPQDTNAPHPYLEFEGGEESPVVENCTFKPVKNQAMYINVGVESTKNAKITGCDFEYDDGMYRIAFLTGEGAVWDGNRVYPVVSSVTGTGDMLRTSGQHTTIKNSYFEGLANTDRGIHIGRRALSRDQYAPSVENTTIVNMGNQGIEVRGDDDGVYEVVSPRIDDCTILNCNQNGNADGVLGSTGVSFSETRDPSVSDSTIGDTQSTATQRHPVLVLSDCDDAELDDNSYFGHATADAPNDGGVRTRVSGVIGGGQLGGVDTGSIATAEIDDGTEALADGTTRTAGVTYRWFNGSWVDT